MATTTTTSTTTPPPPGLAEIIALVPNPDEMSVCQELTGGVVTMRERILDFITFMVTEGGAPGAGFRTMVCGIDCTTSTTTTETTTAP